MKITVPTQENDQIGDSLVRELVSDKIQVTCNCERNVQASGKVVGSLISLLK